MRNSMKIARWEIKRNLKNKSFVISLFLTPLIFLLIMAVPTIFQSFKGEPEPVTVYVTDELALWDDSYLRGSEREWHVVMNPADPAAILAELESSEATNTIYIQLAEDVLEEGRIPVYLSDDLNDSLAYSFRALESPLQQKQLQAFGLSEAQVQQVTEGIGVIPIKLSHATDGAPPHEGEPEAASDPLEQIIPAAFAGLVLFSVVITGMMIFQSASQEKKEKISEMILSSVTPGELMQGKIYGYFVLGLVQVAVWMAIAIPLIQWRFDLPLASYLLVPEILPLLFYAIAGYMMFAALFVGLGATVEDINTSGNFQGVVFMVPWLPFMLFGPILADPEGIVAVIGSYFPLTTPGIMLLRLAMLDEWPWTQIVISSVILLISIWLLMKLAGKIFKTGILMYGKNATPGEILKWLRH